MLSFYVIYGDVGVKSFSSIYGNPNLPTVVEKETPITPYRP